jgi:copper homeostasis protein
MILEACVNSTVSAIEAQKGGAARVELCENLPEGGTTPSAGSILAARRNLHIGLFVMIRPRGGDFHYNDLEFEIMKQDIHLAGELGADGVVFGILKPDGTIDMERMKELVELAHPMGITCHRAFDMTLDPYTAMEDLISLGIDRILTSGQRENALAGASLIKDLIRQANRRIILMPGKGINEENLHQVVKETGSTEFHVHLDKKIKSGMKFFRNEVKMGKPDQSEFDIGITDWERVAKAREILSSCESSGKKGFLQ